VSDMGLVALNLGLLWIWLVESMACFPSLLRRRRGDAKKQGLRLELDLVGSCPYLGVDMYMIFPFSAQFDVFLLESSQF